MKKSKSEYSFNTVIILGSEKESFAESFNATKKVFSYADPGIKFSIGYSINF